MRPAACVLLFSAALFNAVHNDQSSAHAEGVLASGLKELTSSYETADPRLAAHLKLHVTSSAGEPLVRIRLMRDVPMASVLRELRAAGFKLQTHSSINPSLVEGYLPLAAVRTAARIKGVQALYATQRPMKNAGAVQSQAVALEKADIVQSSGFDGTGIKVGVLSDSYDTCSACSTHAAQDIATGDLPADGVTVLEDSPDGTDEGRALLQLVHDIAPGSQLGFATANLGELSFAENILALRNDFGADIIVDDEYYFAEPFYSDGIIAQAVDIAAQSGAAYFSSAGNNGLEAYESTYDAVPYANALELNASGRENLKLDQIPASIRPKSFHNFKNPDGSTSIVQRITTAGDNIVVFQWDEPFDLGLVRTDYNIYVFDRHGNWMNPASTHFPGFYTTDNNVKTDEPIEILFLAPFPTDIVGGANASDYQIVLGKMNDGTAQHIKYLVANGLAVSQRQNAPSIFGHAAATGARAVGAAYYAIPSIPEDFSAQGPVTIYLDSAGNRLAQPEIRKVPQLTAADGVDTTFFGYDTDGNGLPNFFGTSAAAPDAAAVGALVLEVAGGSGSLSPKQLYQRMEDTATPILVAEDRAVAVAKAGPVSLKLNGDWTRWDRDFTLLLAEDSPSPLASVSIDTAPDSLVWSTNPNRFSIGKSSGITYDDITRSPFGSLYTLSFADDSFAPGGWLAFGMSVYAPIESSTQEDPDRFDGAKITVKLRNGEKFSGKVEGAPLISHGPFTGYGLVDAAKAAFPSQ